MASASCSETTTAWEYSTVEYAAGVDTIELPEIDCSLLTTLLEEYSSEAAEGENLAGFSPRSSPTTAACDVDFEDCDLEDMLQSHVQEYYCSTSTPSMDAAAAFGWVDMDVVVPSSPSAEMGDWFVGGAEEVGMMDFEDSEGYNNLLYSRYCDDELVHVEDGYSPLWQ